MKTRIEKFILLFTPVLIGLALSQASFAGTEGHGGDGFVNEDDCTDCGGAPVEGPNFEKTQKAFERGVAPKPEQLVGTWKRVLGAPWDWEMSYFYFGEEREVGSNSSGFKNKDGSDVSTLLISTQKNDFDNETTLYYSFLNIIEKDQNQGPYEGEFRSNSLCMSHYAYNYTYNEKLHDFDHPGQIYKYASQSYACKLVRGRTDLLLCSETLYGSWGRHADYIGKVMGFVGYKKVK